MSDCDHTFERTKDHYTCKLCGHERSIISHCYAETLKEAARVEALPEAEQLEEHIVVQRRKSNEEFAKLCALEAKRAALKPR